MGNRGFTAGAIGVLLALAATVSPARSSEPQSRESSSPNVPVAAREAALRARYGGPGSRYMQVDGTTVHYVDEGHGPVIVLLHGSFSSLRSWNEWAKALRGHYRVVRFDMPPAGLSGSAPDGDNGTDRHLAILDGLTRRLGIDRFLLVATSSGGITGAAYAAEHPERLTGFIYSNGAVGPVHFDTAAFPPALKAAIAADKDGNGIHKPEFWRQVMLFNFSNKERVTPALVREWTDLNNRTAFMPKPPASARAPSHDRTADDLPRITVPTLFLWSADEREVPLERDGRKGFALLGARDKTLVVVPHCGHMMPLDCGPEALAMARPFIDRIVRADSRP